MSKSNAEEKPEIIDWLHGAFLVLLESRRISSHKDLADKLLRLLVENFGGLRVYLPKKHGRKLALFSTIKHEFRNDNYASLSDEYGIPEGEIRRIIGTDLRTLMGKEENSNRSAYINTVHDFMPKVLSILRENAVEEAGHVSHYTDSSVLLATAAGTIRLEVQDVDTGDARTLTAESSAPPGGGGGGGGGGSGGGGGGSGGGGAGGGSPSDGGGGGGSADWLLLIALLAPLALRRRRPV